MPSLGVRSPCFICKKRMYVTAYDQSYHYNTVHVAQLLNAHHQDHGLRTPNEGINQRYLKNWADVADKICFGRT